MLFILFIRVIPDIRVSIEPFISTVHQEISSSDIRNLSVLTRPSLFTVKKKAGNLTLCASPQTFN